MGHWGIAGSSSGLMIAAAKSGRHVGVEGEVAIHGWVVDRYVQNCAKSAGRLAKYQVEWCEAQLVSWSLVP